MRTPQRLATGCALLALALSAGSGLAAADPEPAPGPAPAPNPPPDPFVVASEQTAEAPGQTLADLLGAGSGANPADVLNAGVGLSAPPAVNPLLTTPLLQPQNFRMPAPDQISPYPLAPNVNPSPFARIDAFKGVHALLHGGLGRMPGEDLSAPLPGTAPPPDAGVPPGLEQFYLAPAAPPPPG